MHRLIASALLVCCLTAPARAADPHNVVLFVAGGLRGGMVTEETAPAMAALLKQGVRFINSHAVFPTNTLPNAAALATGHMAGDTGAFGDLSSVSTLAADDTPRPSRMSDMAPRQMDRHLAGAVGNQDTILRLAAEAGISTAVVGPAVPGQIFGASDQTVRIDDMTGRPGGIPLPADMLAALKRAGIPAQAPAGPDPTGRDWFADVATKALPPLFRDRHKPFLLVVWSRDPDATQRIQGDSPGRLMPGINGPASLAAIHRADDDLARLLAALKALGMEATTDVLLASDHGASTISKDSATSFAASQSYKDVPAQLLPPGFVAIDLAHGLGLRLFDPDARAAPVPAGTHPLRANGLLGDDPAHPLVVVVANGGSDLVYLPAPDPALAARIVHLLAAQDYTSGMFADSRLGSIPGTLPLSALGLEGSTGMPLPALVVNFRSFSLGCADPTTCAAGVADSVQQQGQGAEGSFGRAHTRNVMGAIGPGFRTAYTDPMPASTADIGLTIAALLGLTLPAKGGLAGRVLTEAMPNGAMVGTRPLTLRSAPDEAGRVTVVKYQTVGAIRYFDAAGYPGRSQGLE